MTSTNIRTALGVLLLSGIVVAGHLLPGLDNSEIQNGIRNSLHVLVFATFALVVFGSLTFLGKSKAVIAALTITAIVGGLSEFLQYSIGRQPDFNDLLRDLAGASLALFGRLLVVGSQNEHRSRFGSYAFRALALFSAIAIATPLLYWLTVIALGRSTFPTLVSFDQWWAKHLYYSINSSFRGTNIISDASLEKSTAIEISLSRKGRSGIAMLPMTPDWSEFNYLTFIATMLEGPDTAITIRINDGNRLGHYSNHFNASVTVGSQPTIIRIPFENLVSDPVRPNMDLSDIQEIVIFARDKRAGTVLMLASIRLE